MRHLPLPIPYRFWTKVKVADGCWKWKGATDKEGYGYIKTGFRKTGFKMVLAHRLSYILNVGKIPRRKDILHSCDNRSCVNPRHLRPGTHRQNMKDAVKRKRFNRAKGENCIFSKLKESDVIYIRKMYSEGNTTQKKIADLYGVTKGAISHIINRLNWTHI